MINIDRGLIKAAILAAIIWFMRNDLVLALIIALVSYFAPRIGL
jgi:hypothetical protein